MTTMTLGLVLAVGRRWDIFDFVAGLLHGDPFAWFGLSAICGLIVFFLLYENVTGKPFVKSRNERREARKRRKFVLWEYRRDD